VRVTKEEFTRLSSRATGKPLQAIAEAARFRAKKAAGEVSATDAGQTKRKRKIGASGVVKPNKYRAKKVATDEGVFDSQMEYKRWCELKALQADGVIKDLERQIVYPLEVNGVKIGRFTADHRWRDPVTSAVCVEDVKGVLVRDFTLRVKLMKAIHGIDVQVWPKRKRKARKRRLSTK